MQMCKSNTWHLTLKEPLKFFYALVMKQIKNLDGHYELFKSLEEPDHEVVLAGLKLSSSNTMHICFMYTCFYHSLSETNVYMLDTLIGVSSTDPILQFYFGRNNVSMNRI